MPPILSSYEHGDHSLSSVGTKSKDEEPDCSIGRTFRTPDILPVDHLNHKREPTPPAPPGKFTDEISKGGESERVTVSPAASPSQVEEARSSPKTTKHPDVDGGWAWMVLVGACLVYFIMDSGYSPGGLYNTAFMEQYKEDASVISLVSAIPGALISLAASLANLLSEKIGTRPCIVLGATLVTGGVILTALYDSFISIIIGFGILRGVGHSLVYIPAMVVLGGYFDKYRNLVFALSSCFAGMGSIVNPIVFTACIEMYSWRGSLFILAGYSLNYFVCAVILKPIDHTKRVTVSRADDQSLSQIGPRNNRMFDRFLVSFRDFRMQHIGDNLRQSYLKARRQSYSLKQEPCNLVISSFKTLPDINLTSISIISDGNMNQLQNMTDRVHLKDKDKHRRCLGYMNTPFTLFLIGHIFVMLGISILYLHLPSFFISRGATNAEVSYALSAQGVANILARAVFGIVSSSSKCNVTILYITVLVLGAVSLALAEVICVALWGFVLYASLCGFFCIGNFALFAALSIEYIGLENFGKAFSVSMMAGGIGYMIGSPLAGFLYDTTQSVANSFYLAGACFAVAGIMMIPVLCIPSRRQPSGEVTGCENSACVEGGNGSDTNKLAPIEENHKLSVILDLPVLAERSEETVVIEKVNTLAASAG